MENLYMNFFFFDKADSHISELQNIALQFNSCPYTPPMFFGQSLPLCLSYYAQYTPKDNNTVEQKYEHIDDLLSCIECLVKISNKNHILLPSLNYEMEDFLYDQNRFIFKRIYQCINFTEDVCIHNAKNIFKLLSVYLSKKPLKIPKEILIVHPIKINGYKFITKITDKVSLCEKGSLKYVLKKVESNEKMFVGKEEIKIESQYFVMQYFEHESLESIFNIIEYGVRFPDFSANKKKNIVYELVKYISYLSSLKENYAELSPSRILLDMQYNPNFVKNSPIDMNKVLSSNFHFFPPEVLQQIVNKENVLFNEKTDIYQIGLIIYCLENELTIYSGVRSAKELLGNFLRANTSIPSFSRQTDHSIVELVNKCTEMNCNLRPTLQEILVKCNNLVFSSKLQNNRNQTFINPIQIYRQSITDSDSEEMFSYQFINNLYHHKRITNFNSKLCNNYLAYMKRVMESFGPISHDQLVLSELIIRNGKIKGAKDFNSIKERFLSISNACPKIDERYSGMKEFIHSLIQINHSIPEYNEQKFIQNIVYPHGFSPEYKYVILFIRKLKIFNPKLFTQLLAQMTNTRIANKDLEDILRNRIKELSFSNNENSKEISDSDFKLILLELLYSSKSVITKPFQENTRTICQYNETEYNNNADTDITTILQVHGFTREAMRMLAFRMFSTMSDKIFYINEFNVGVGKHSGTDSSGRKVEKLNRILRMACLVLWEDFDIHDGVQLIVKAGNYRIRHKGRCLHNSKSNNETNDE